MKQCRVILTTECNLKCPYCCNKIKEVQDSFKMITIDQLLEKEYDCYNITGGEVGLAISKLINICTSIKNYHPLAKTFVYTNGYLDKVAEFWEMDELFSLVDGFNVGYHEGQYMWDATRLAIMLNKRKPTRLHINDKVFANLKPNEDRCVHEAIKEGVTLVLWKMNECNNQTEDRWII